MKKIDSSYRIQSYAHEEKTTCDKDVQGIVFDTPVEIYTNKYVNTGKYGSSTSYTGTLEKYETSAISNYRVDAFLPVEKDGKTQKKDWDNSYQLYDNSITAKALDPTFEGNILLPVRSENGRNIDKPIPGQEEDIDLDIYTDPSPLTFVNLIYEDSYGAQTKQRNYDYTYLSANHEYCFGNPEEGSTEVFGYSSIKKGENPYFDVIKGTNENYFKVTTSGYYNINVYVPKTAEGETREATLNINLVMPYEDSRYTQDYANIYATFDSNLKCTYYDYSEVTDPQEEPKEESITSGKDNTIYRKFNGSRYVMSVSETGKSNEQVLTVKDSNIILSDSDNNSVSVHPSIKDGFVLYPSYNFIYSYLDDFDGIASVNISASTCKESNVKSISLKASYKKYLKEYEYVDSIEIDNCYSEIEDFTFNSAKDNIFNIVIDDVYPTNFGLYYLDTNEDEIPVPISLYTYDKDNGNLTIKKEIASELENVKSIYLGPVSK